MPTIFESLAIVQAALDARDEQDGDVSRRRPRSETPLVRIQEQPKRKRQKVTDEQEDSHPQQPSHPESRGSQVKDGAPPPNVDDSREQHSVNGQAISPSNIDDRDSSVAGASSIIDSKVSSGTLKGGGARSPRKKSHLSNDDEEQPRNIADAKKTAVKSGKPKTTEMAMEERGDTLTWRQSPKQTQARRIVQTTASPVHPTPSKQLSAGEEHSPTPPPKQRALKQAPAVPDPKSNKKQSSSESLVTRTSSENNSKNGARGQGSNNNDNTQKQHAATAGNETVASDPKDDEDGTETQQKKSRQESQQEPPIVAAAMEDQASNFEDEEESSFCTTAKPKSSPVATTTACAVDSERSGSPEQREPDSSQVAKSLTEQFQQLLKDHPKEAAQVRAIFAHAKQFVEETDVEEFLSSIPTGYPKTTEVATEEKGDTLSQKTADAPNETESSLGIQIKDGAPSNANDTESRKQITFPSDLVARDSSVAGASIIDGKVSPNMLKGDNTKNHEKNSSTVTSESSQTKRDRNGSTGPEEGADGNGPGEIVDDAGIVVAGNPIDGFSDECPLFENNVWKSLAANANSTLESGVEDGATIDRMLEYMEKANKAVDQGYEAFENYAKTKSDGAHIRAVSLLTAAKTAIEEAVQVCDGFESMAKVAKRIGSPEMAPEALLQELESAARTLRQNVQGFKDASKKSMQRMDDADSQLKALESNLDLFKRHDEAEEAALEEAVKRNQNFLDNTPLMTKMQDLVQKRSAQEEELNKEEQISWESGQFLYQKTLKAKETAQTKLDEFKKSEKSHVAFTKKLEGREKLVRKEKEDRRMSMNGHEASAHQLAEDTKRMERAAAVAEKFVKVQLGAVNLEIAREKMDYLLKTLKELAAAHDLFHGGFDMFAKQEA